MVKSGRSDLARNAGLEQILQEERPANGVPAAPEANGLANDLERLGPTFIKLWFGLTLISRCTKTRSRQALRAA